MQIRLRFGAMRKRRYVLPNRRLHGWVEDATILGNGRLHGPDPRPEASIARSGAGAKGLETRPARGEGFEKTLTPEGETLKKWSGQVGHGVSVVLDSFRPRFYRLFGACQPGTCCT